MNTHSDVSDHPPAPSNKPLVSKPVHSLARGFLARVAPVLLRWALGLTILSAVADRFGLWGSPGTANVSWGDWPHFVAYTAKVNSFLPGLCAPALAVTATVAEALLGLALLLGAFPRPIST